MIKQSSYSGYSVYRRRKRTIYNIALIALFAVILSLIPLYIFNYSGENGADRRDLLLHWESLAFDKVYQLSGEQLVQKPMDYFLLTINGFSAYQLAIAQINNSSTLNFINTCIWALRKAMLFKEGADDGRLFYVLGKAYYYKGIGYEDLAIKYLVKARESGFDARDIPEYLGLAYASASVGDYKSSIEAFTQVLNPQDYAFSPSDALLLSIANSYIALGEDEAAQVYLRLCLEASRDFSMISTVRLSLAQIFLRNADFVGAEALYNEIIEEGGNADAHFYLGELYNSRGEVVRARAEWRRAIIIDPSHRQARSRLNL
jgi:tetratricopeptide (TPR) repeat protein